MKYLFYLVPMAILLSLGCGPKHNDNEVKALYDKVIEIHDEVMPKISNISKLKRKVRKQDSTSPESLQLLGQLENADDAMMSWMSDFQVYKSYNDSTKQSKMKYLNNEKVRITSVSDEMYKAIKSAKAYLNEN